MYNNQQIQNEKKSNVVLGKWQENHVHKYEHTHKDKHKHIRTQTHMNTHKDTRKQQINTNTF